MVVVPEPPGSFRSGARRTHGRRVITAAAAGRPASSAATERGGEQDLREAILAATTGLLAERAFADLSVAEILTAAGVSRGTFYFYFDSKHDVLAELVRRAAPGLDAAVARCVFGPLPFRTVSISPAWSTSTVTQVAAGIYEERAFDRMPILADALEDAGCTDVDVVGHCRGQGPHVRGCWVVDLLTQRA